SRRLKHMTRLAPRVLRIRYTQAMRYLLWVAVAIFGVHALSGADSDKISFNRDIRPIMSDTCFRCHGPDKSSRMAGMRLDIREEALKANRAGAAPIVPGDPTKSAIVARVFATDGRIMPRRSRTRN